LETRVYEGRKGRRISLYWWGVIQCIDYGEELGIREGLKIFLLKNDDHEFFFKWKMVIVSFLD